MADYLGRTGSCTEGRFHPDTNLSAYAREHGFQTALVAAKFKGTNKLYTYWGHTGMKRGDYAKVLVPRPGSRQEETVVRIVAVIPALQLKQSSGRTAKHIQSVMEGCIPTSMKIPLPNDMFTQSWRNAASFDIVPHELTEHAKACMAEIDGVLGDEAVDFKTATTPPDEFLRVHEPWRLYKWYMDQLSTCVGYGAASGTCTVVGDDSARVVPTAAIEWLESERKCSQAIAAADFSQLEMRAAARQCGKEQHLREKIEQYREAYPAITDACKKMPELTPEFIESLLEYPAVGAGRPKSFRHSYLTDLGPCGRETTKETIMSAKIQTVTYVTLPGCTSRVDASQLPASSYFDAIATLEAQIAKLEKINTKPRSLKQQIEDLQQQVDELATLADLYHAKKEPLLGQAEQADPKDASGYTAGDAAAARDE